jgi:acyl-CoA synthetase (AMP-forming)/AMP-acid ligase II
MLNLADAVAHQAGLRPDHPAIVDGERTFSYAVVAAEVRAVAERLSALGVDAGDRVGLCLKERAEFLIALFATARIWGVSVPVSWRAPETERRQIVESLGLKVLICEPGDTGVKGAIDWPALRALAPRSRPSGRAPADTANPPFLIALSSGSTGLPKGLVVSHEGQLMRNIRTHIDLRHGFDMRYFSCTPLVHASGRNKCIGCLISGNTVVMHPPFFRADELVEAVARHAATDLYLVPTMLRTLLELGQRAGPLFPGLRHLVVGAAPVSAEQRTIALRLLTPHMYISYGASGYSTVALLRLVDEQAPPDSVGRPTFLTEVDFVDDEFRSVADKAEGRIRVRGPGLASEIIGSGSAAEEAEFLRDGWYYTGDLGYRSESGFLILTGRAANRIRRGGMSISAEEIERILNQHPAVAETAVIGRPSDELGQDVIAFIIPRRQVDREELERHCRRHLTRTKVPAEFYFVQSFPRTSAGKVIRRTLLETVMSKDAIARKSIDEYR